ncbi:MAG: radical SAM protein [Deltaproteobacteria bacterium]|nr:radical SAM protein [Deltaproteobacteria bacterium]
MTEFLLFNGFTPLRRSPADLFLDNGIGMLRANLKRAEIDFEINDPISLDKIQEFNHAELNASLRHLFKKQIFGETALRPDEYAKLLEQYQEMLAFHQHKMHQMLEDISDHVAAKQIPIVGIKLWAGSTFQYCIELCELIGKKSPETLLVAGGPQVNCYSFEGQILKLTPFDVAIYSEGEHALLQLILCCRYKHTKRKMLAAVQNANIPNCIYRAGKDVIVNPVEVADVNEKCFPEYDDLNGKVPVHTIVDALGCDYGKCSFCIHPCIYPKFRKRTPQLIVDEMVHMVRQGIGLFSFTASDTPLPHAVRISEEILKRKLKIDFTMLTRARRNAHKHTEHITEQFRVIVRAGLKSVFFGVESGNDHVLNEVMNKGVTANDMAVTMDCLRNAAKQESKWVNIIASFIYPVPLPLELKNKGLDSQTVLSDNLKLLKRMQPDSFHAIPGLLYPGTRWYTHPEEYDIHFDRETFPQKWITQEFSSHGYVTLGKTSLFSFGTQPFHEMIQESIEFMRKGNALGIPSDLWEEQFIFARAANITGIANLQRLSEDLHLDLLTCNDKNTRYLYDAASRYSRSLALSNTHLFSDTSEPSDENEPSQSAAV